MKRLVTLGLLLALTGCGTTVSTSAGGAAPTVAGDGLSVPASPTGQVAAPGSSVVRGTGPITGQAPTTSGPAGPGSASGGAAAPRASAVVTQGRGVTATSVTIGAVVTTSEAAVADALGIKGAGTISQKGVVQAKVDEINRAGGLFGRKLAVYFHEFDAASMVTRPDEVVAAICSDFRDDHPVFAVFFSLTNYPALRACLAKMGTPLIGGNGVASTLSAKAYDDHGGNYLFGPNAITQERLAHLFIDSLADRSFFEKWDTTQGQAGGAFPTKVGAIHPDTPESAHFYRLLSAELAKHGQRFAQEVTYPSSFQAGLSATQNAVLKFRSEGVTHVFGASVFFLQTAESQGYRPRYAYQPGLGALGVANSPPAQMRGSQTVGWTPTIDVNGPQDPGDTPGAARCRQLMAKAGFTSSNRNDLATMYAVCDWIGSFRNALLSGGGVSVPALRRGYELLGSGFPTALTFRALLGPTRHYGVDAVRDLAYDTGCQCLRYTSKTDRR